MKRSIFCSFEPHHRPCWPLCFPCLALAAKWLWSTRLICVDSRTVTTALFQVRWKSRVCSGLAERRQQYNRNLTRPTSWINFLSDCNHRLDPQRTLRHALLFPHPGKVQHRIFFVYPLPWFILPVLLHDDGNGGFRFQRDIQRETYSDLIELILVSCCETTRKMSSLMNWLSETDPGWLVGIMLGCVQRKVREKLVFPAHFGSD